MIKALALIVGPLLCGVVIFLIEAPAQVSGAYAEMAEGIYLLSHCGSEPPSPTDVSTGAPVASGAVGSFLLVLPDSVSAPVIAQSARLFLRVVNRAEPQTDYGRAPLGTTTVRRLNSRLYRVTSDQAMSWESSGVVSSAYRQALSRIPGNRATTELLVELEIPAWPAGPCGCSLVLGPPPSLPSLPVKWFVPAAERHQ